MKILGKFDSYLIKALFDAFMFDFGIFKRRSNVSITVY